VLADFRSAPIDDKLRATLAFLEKVTLDPEEVKPADARAVLATGVSEAGVRDAIAICALFNIIDRLADATGFEVLSKKDFAKYPRILLRAGYQP
jgi:alkylhydroperoxidase family enzyme